MIQGCFLSPCVSTTRTTSISTDWFPHSIPTGNSGSGESIVFIILLAAELAATLRATLVVRRTILAQCSERAKFDCCLSQKFFVVNDNFLWAGGTVQNCRNCRDGNHKFMRLLFSFKDTLTFIDGYLSTSTATTSLSAVEVREFVKVESTEIVRATTIGNGELVFAGSQIHLFRHIITVTIFVRKLRSISFRSIERGNLPRGVLMIICELDVDLERGGWTINLCDRTIPSSCIRSTNKCQVLLVDLWNSEGFLPRGTELAVSFNHDDFTIIFDENNFVKNGIGISVDSIIRGIINLEFQISSRRDDNVLE
mmetsp:Transcript_12829/g.30298  ORF Transcript_12829/g.30298 Transcript_12829/m.30298 type:complete len:310 (+) Transcript_12829:279-1208(+)